MTDSAAPSNHRALNCKNCGTALTGRHCHACGQDSRSPPERLAQLIRLFLSHATGIEGTAQRTLFALLFQPGGLTRDYVTGRRVRYANPVQVYLWCTAMFFMLHAYSPLVHLDVDTGTVTSSLSVVSLNTEIPTAAMERPSIQTDSTVGFTERFDTIVTATLPIMLVVLVAASALVVAAMFWGESVLTHIVFALHWSAFYFALETARQILLNLLGSWGPPISALGSVIIFIYLVVAMRVVYKRSWFGSALRAAFGIVVFAVLLVAWLWSATELSARLA